jgi:hypothetical protein
MQKKRILLLIGFVLVFFILLAILVFSLFVYYNNHSDRNYIIYSIKRWDSNSVIYLYNHDLNSSMFSDINISILPIEQELENNMTGNVYRTKNGIIKEIKWDKPEEIKIIILEQEIGEVEVKSIQNKKINIVYEYN